MKRVLLVIGLICACLTVASLATADVIDPLDNMAAPPGTFAMVTYFGHLSLPDIADSDGDTTDFGYDQSYAVLRPVYFAGKIADTLSYGVNAILPVAHVSIDDGNSDTGFGDVGISPFIYLYENAEQQLYISFWEFVFLPTGDYDKNNLVNVGRDTYWFQHQLAFGWYPGKFGIDLNVNYFMFTESDELEYDEADALEIETVVHYAVTDKLRVGVNAAYWRGMEDAEIEGETIDDSKPENWKLGLNLSYALTETFSAGVRWMHDIESENYPEGDWVYLKLAYVF